MRERAHRIERRACVRVRLLRGGEERNSLDNAQEQLRRVGRLPFQRTILPNGRKAFPPHELACLGRRGELGYALRKHAELVGAVDSRT